MHYSTCKSCKFQISHSVQIVVQTRIVIQSSSFFCILVPSSMSGVTAAVPEYKTLAWLQTIVKSLKSSDSTDISGYAMVNRAAFSRIRTRSANSNKTRKIYISKIYIFLLFVHTFAFKLTQNLLCLNPPKTRGAEVGAPGGRRGDKKSGSPGGPRGAGYPVPALVKTKNYVI